MKNWFKIKKERQVADLPKDIALQIANDTSLAIEAHFESYKEKSLALAAQGAIDGSRGIPNDLHPHSVVEVKINTQANNFLHRLDQQITRGRESLDQLRQRAIHWESSELNEAALIRDRNEREHKAKKRLQWQVDIPIWKIHWHWHKWRMGGVTGLVRTLEDRLKFIKRQKQEQESMSAQLLLNYGAVPPIKLLLDRRFIFYGAIIALFIVECLVNFGAFQQMDMGGNNIGALTLGTFFALFQAIAAKLAGQAFQDKRWKKLIIFSTLTLILCSLISLTRWQVADGIVNQLVGVTVNFLIATLTFYMAYIHHKHSVYFKLERTRRRLEKKTLLLTQWIENLSQQMDANKITSNQKLNAEYQQAQQGLQNAQFSLQQQLLQAEEVLSHLVENTKQKVEQIRKNAHEEYKRLNRLAREKLEKPPFNQWEQPSSSVPRHNSSLVRKLPAICLLLSIGLFGCQQHLPSTHIELLYDQSDLTLAPDTSGMVSAILNLIHEPLTTGEWGTVNVNLSQIGETTNQKIWTVTLPASPPYWLRSEVKQQAIFSQFKEELTQTIGKVAQATAEMNESHIHQNFYYRLQWLQKQTGKKWVLSWSDLLLNDGKINFYQYQLAPELLLEEKEALWLKLESDYPLGDLNNITIVNFHLPTRHDDALHEIAKHFFGDYWRSHGMEVEFRTNHNTDTALTVIAQ